ncbi:LysR family transcriptional regulator [Nesterenkonia ebinurensis]|uniref:LysR family transcriptional regulator n=1 Tax=Nesterenkonia ebinurensis TaxID=2608252 RepID=UPI00168A5AC2|nr:LysR family transcriptional regulator [Nesterenkonia ebinurensis]
MLDLHRLRIFRAVLTEGTVNGAAANLRYTSSAISQQLQTLQRETGVILLERKGRRVALTAAGELFAQKAEELLAHAAEVEDFVADLKRGRTGTLTVAHIASIGPTWIPTIAANLAEQYPQLSLNLRLWETLRASGAEADVEIYVDYAGVRELPDYHSIQLLNEPYVAVVPAHHWAAERDEVALQDLREETWVDNDVTKGICRQVLLDACASRGFTPAFRLETQDYASAVAFVETGSGITVLPRLSFDSVRADDQRVAAVPVVDPAPTRTLAVRYKKNLAGQPVIKHLLNLLEEKIDELPT